MHYDNNNVNNGCFTFTAEHEEPFCHQCDLCALCDGENIKCGPEFSWSKYRRTVNIDDFTPLDEVTYKSIMQCLGMKHN